MTARFIRFLQFWVTSFDILTLNIVFFIVIFLFPGNLFNAHWEYTYLAIFLSFAWLTISLLGNIYQKKNILSFENFIKQSMRAIVYFIALIIVYLFFFQQYIISRAFILIVLVSIPISFLINRFIYFAIYEHYKRKDYLLDKVLFVGYNNISKKLISYFEENSFNKEIIGICDESDKINEVYHYPILSSISGAFEVCKKYGANEIFSSIAPEQNPEIYSLMQLADQNCIRFRIVPDISFFVKRKVHINYIDEMPVLTLREEPLEDLANRIKKRLFDIVISTLVIVFMLSWLVPLISLLIKLDSKGPVFFMQKRSGKENKTFLCIKFRSMKVNNHSDLQQATKNDERFTRLGRFLRHSNLDEFPQFFNVLIGHMSIVGPRPHMLKHTDEYAQIAEQYMVRHFMKPGITGWAQVNGCRGEIDSLDKLESRIERDIWYMENWGIWLDLKIIFLTIYNTLKGDKNAF